MGECDYPGCSGDSTLQNSCSYCDYDYCSEHRLPERHNCPALSEVDTLGPEFRQEFNVETGDADSSTLCDNCESAPVVFGEEFCEDCLKQMTGRGEKAQCENCSNYTSADRDLCLECRRKEQTIDSKSPDVQLDGSVDREESFDGEQTNPTESGGLLSRLKSVFKRG